MSLAALIGQHSITVKDKNATKDTSGGLTNPNRPALYSNVPAYVQALSSKQMMQFGELLIEADHYVFTQQDGILNGHLIVTDDGRMLRVTGKSTIQNMGTIPGYYRLSAMQVS